MWIPSFYKITDEKVIQEFISTVGLATLITHDNPFPMATHTAMELEYDNDGNRFLRGHIAKANPQSELLKKKPNALVIFQSSINHYISSSWYEQPNAPTWNYMSVHLYGQVSILDDEALWQAIERLTKRHEKVSKNPVSLMSLPPNIQQMLKAVTGFEVKIEKVEAAFKLSQNRNQNDYKNIINELLIMNTPLSNLMAETLKTNQPF